MTKKYALAIALLVVGTLAGTQIAPDYYDRGRIGFVAMLAVGWIAAFVAARWARASEPAYVATCAILPWSLALGGVSYLGFIFLPLEVVATAFILRRLTPLRGARLALVAIVIRAVAFVPIVLLGMAGASFAVTR
ncbi:MAG: hypothetical protein JO197_03310 [Acidobacteria bacterium]|nr:hypothetical protein [Acidobacteriota bacterium]MBV9476588.1 hypothetical protein [Acidobacteriota bacterium]